MSQIRKQSIISTVFVYAGFLIGFVNTYLFTRQGSLFTPEEYGLTGIFMAVGNIMFVVANFGMISVVYKFYPYYNDNLPKKKNDLLTLTLGISLLGFTLVILGGWLFKDLVVRKFGGNSPIFLQYYFWVFPFGLGILLFSVFEVFAWQIRQSIFSTFLREFLFRVVTMALIILMTLHVLPDFDSFIKFYAFSYGAVAAVLLIFLIIKGEFHITFEISRVTRKYARKMGSMAGLMYMGSTVFMIAQFIDSLIIMSVRSLADVAVFTLATVVAGLVQAPQRGAVAASTPVLAKAWKDKDLERIGLVYQRSGINLLIVSLAIFLLIWLNYTDIVVSFKLKAAYLDSMWVFFFLGLSRVIDLGTGVNSQIIATSVFWRFEFVSGIVLLALALPLNYILIKEFGIVGAGYANLISITGYNVIRILFLKRKYNMHPFSYKTVWAILIAFVCYGLCYFVFGNLHGFAGIFVKSCVFIALYGGSVFYLNLTPDLEQVMNTMKKRFKK